MLISCPHCGFSKEIDRHAIPAGTVKVTCPSCRQSFPLPDREEAQPTAPQPEAVFTAQAQPEAADRQPAAETLPKAGFWIRVVATLVDTFIVSVLQFLLGMLLAFAGLASLGIDQGASGSLTLLVQLFAVVLGFVYYVFFTGYCGQTPGKMALRIKVIRCDGAEIGYGRAALREIPAKFISGIILGIGYLMVAFDEQKQGLHDRMADTYVIKL